MIRLYDASRNKICYARNRKWIRKFLHWTDSYNFHFSKSIRNNDSLILWTFREDIFLVLVANRIHQLVDFIIFVSLSRVDRQAFFEKNNLKYLHFLHELKIILKIHFETESTIKQMLRFRFIQDQLFWNDGTYCSTIQYLTNRMFYIF